MGNAADSTLRLVTQMDTSAIQAGCKESAAAVESATSKIKVDFSTANAQIEQSMGAMTTSTQQLQTQVPAAAAAVEASAKKMAASFKETEAASASIVRPEPVIVYGEMLDQVVVESKKVTQANVEVKASLPFGAISAYEASEYTAVLKKLGLTEAQVAEQQILFSKMTVKQREEEILACEYLIKQEAQRAAAVVAAGALEEGVHKKSTHNVTEARHAIVGLGEEFGIRMPRHISTFLSHLGPVASVMSMAFAPIAVIGILQVIGELPEQIEKGISALRGWDEEAKKAYNEAAEAALKAGEGFATFERQVKMAMATAGKSGTVKIKSEQEELAGQLVKVNDEWNATSAAIGKQKAELKGLEGAANVYTDALMRQGDIQGAVTAYASGKAMKMFQGKEIDKAKTDLDILEKKLQSLSSTRSNLTTQQSMLPIALGTENESQAYALRDARIEAEKKVATSGVAMTKSLEDARYKLGMIGLQDYTAAQIKAVKDQMKHLILS